MKCLARWSVARIAATLSAPTLGVYYLAGSGCSGTCHPGTPTGRQRVHHLARGEFVLPLRRTVRHPDGERRRRRRPDPLLHHHLQRDNPRRTRGLRGRHQLLGDALAERAGHPGLRGVRGRRRPRRWPARFRARLQQRGTRHLVAAHPPQARRPAYNPRRELRAMRSRSILHGWTSWCAPTTTPISRLCVRQADPAWPLLLTCPTCRKQFKLVTAGLWKYLRPETTPGRRSSAAPGAECAIGASLTRGAWLSRFVPVLPGEIIQHGPGLGSVPAERLQIGRRRAG